MFMVAVVEVGLVDRVELWHTAWFVLLFVWLESRDFRSIKQESEHEREKRRKGSEQTEDFACISMLFEIIRMYCKSREEGRSMNLVKLILSRLSSSNLR